MASIFKVSFFEFPTLKESRTLVKELGQPTHADLESLQLHLASYESANADEPRDKIQEFHDSSAKIRALFGGNRSGKTESGAYELLRLCAKHPGQVFWACTESYKEIGAYVWPKIKKYLSPDDILNISWSNAGQEIPVQIRLKNGSILQFKTYDQKRRRFQGASVQAIWLDEEPDEDIYKECLARTIDCRGAIMLTMTPMRGLTWAYDQIHEVQEDPDVQHWTISILENKYIPQEEKDRFIARLSQDEIAKRVYGLFTRLEGAVWKEFNESVNLIPRFPIPRYWRRIRSIDFGYANPFCCLWLAQGEDGEIYIFNEWYQKETLLKDHAAMIHEKDGERLKTEGPDRGIETSVADHEAQERAELEEYGISTEPANKEVELGIQIVNRYFKQKPNGRASLYIFDDLPNIRREIQNYHYPKGKIHKNESELPEKKDDHTQDAMRYGVMYFAEGVPEIDVTTTGEKRIMEQVEPLDFRGYV